MSHYITGPFDTITTYMSYVSSEDEFTFLKIKKYCLTFKIFRWWYQPRNQGGNKL